MTGDIAKWLDQLKRSLTASPPADAKLTITKNIDLFSENLPRDFQTTRIWHPATLADLEQTLTAILNHPIYLEEATRGKLSALLRDLQEYQESLRAESLARETLKLSHITSLVNEPASLPSDFGKFSCSPPLLKMALQRATYIYAAAVWTKGRKGGLAIGISVDLHKREDGKGGHVTLWSRVSQTEEIVEAGGSEIVRTWDSSLAAAVKQGVKGAFTYANQLLCNDLSGYQRDPTFIPSDYDVDCVVATYELIDGPSLGLAATIATLAKLADLPTRHRMAFTGEIEALDIVKVGKVGDVDQKIQAAEEAGIPYIVVPRNNYDELPKKSIQEHSLNYLREHITIHPAEYISDAIASAFDIEELRKSLINKHQEIVTRENANTQKLQVISQRTAISLLGIFLFIIGALWFILTYPIADFFYHFPSDKIGVAIMSFPTAVNPYLKAEDIRSKSEDIIDLRNIKFRDFAHRVESPEAAQEWGRKKGAKIVVWGYTKTAEGRTQPYARVTLVNTVSTKPTVQLISPWAELISPWFHEELYSGIPFLSAFTLNVQNQWMSASTPDIFHYLEVETSQATLALLAVLSYLAENHHQTTKILTELVHVHSSKNPYLPLALAAIHVEQANWELANDALERLKKLNPDEAKPWVLAGVIYSIMGNDPAAISMAERAASINSSDPLIYLLLISSLNRIGAGYEHNPKLIENLKRLLSHNQILHDIIESRDKILNGDINQGVNILQKSFRSREDFPKALGTLGVEFIQYGQKSKGIDLIKLAIGYIENLTRKDASTDFLYFFLSGLLAEQEGKNLDAEEYFKKLVEKFSESGNSYIALARFYRKDGKINSEIDTYDSGIKKVKYNRNELMEHLAKAYYASGSLSLAEGIYENLLNIMPFSVANKILLGIVYYCRGKFIEADSLFSTLSGDPFLSAENLRKTRSWILQMSGDAKFAVNDLINAYSNYKEAIDEDNKRGKLTQFLFYRFGLISHRRGDISQAIAAYKNELMYFPKSLWAIILLGIAYIDSDEISKAEEVWSEFLREVTNDIISQNTLYSVNTFTAENLEKTLTSIVKEDAVGTIDLYSSFLSIYNLRKKSSLEAMSLVHKVINTSNYDALYLPLVGLLYIENGQANEVKSKLLDIMNAHSPPEFFPLKSMYSLTPTDGRIWK
jgi:tetratricopeptide (TPR) repeat protein